MPDITMCGGLNCPLKEKCYRYKAEINEFGQSYFLIVPYNDKEKKCEHFWEVK
jgi:hypothetical protein